MRDVLLGKDVLTDVLGADTVKQQLKSALLVNRHVLIVGPPGVGKTTLAKNVAKLLPEREVVKDCEFHCDPKEPICPACKAAQSLPAKKMSGEDRFVRIQGSPDLTVEDLLGDIDPIKALKFGPLSLEAFTPGKIFKANNGILFFDELNRCPEKLQNALLQVLQEGKATIGSYDVDIPASFIFIATMNPEDSSTERLSDVLLDRFDVVPMSYPDTLEQEKKIVADYGVSLCTVPPKLHELMVYFVRLLRECKDLDRRPSVRASLGLYERSQSNALLQKRKTVTLEDVEAVLHSVLAHRISLKPSVRYLKTANEVIKEQFDGLMESNYGDDFKEAEAP